MSAWRVLLASGALRNALLFLGASLGALFGGMRLENEWLVGAAILAVGLGAIRLAGLLLFRALLPSLGAPTPRIAEDLALAIACLAWVMLRLRAAGMDLGSLVTTSALITAVVAFAMQDTLGNLLGGLFLEFDRSLSIGDWVKVDDLSGRVVEIRWRHTAIRTRNGEIAILPNSMLMKARFLVIGNPDEAPVRWRRWVWFEVDPAVPASRVVAAAKVAVEGADIPGVLHDPAPDCVLMEAGAPRCRYALRYWLGDPQRDDAADSMVREHLLAALGRAGIALAQPEVVVHQIKEGRTRREFLHAREIEARTVALHGVELFRGLRQEELGMLAERLVPAPFAAGDTVTRQGAVAHWLYLLADGQAEVWVDSPGALRRRVAELGPGSIFGEMGMMTGEPRRATVTAKTALLCYRLDKEGFADILRSRPAIAEEVSRVLASRASELQHVVEEAHAEAARPHPDTLLHRIRAFFGLTETPTPASGYARTAAR